MMFGVVNNNCEAIIKVKVKKPLDEDTLRQVIQEESQEFRTAK